MIFDLFALDLEHIATVCSIYCVVTITKGIRMAHLGNIFIYMCIHLKCDATRDILRVLFAFDAERKKSS